MTELTKNMKTICIGRLLIDIPRQAKETEGWGGEVDDTEIKTIFPPSPNRQVFDAKVAERVRQLKTSPHDTDGSLLKSRLNLDSAADLLVYRKNASSRRIYQLDAPYWRAGTEMKFHREISNEDLSEGTDEISRLVKSFSPMPTSDFNRLPPGLCIEGGVMTGKTFRGEEIAMGGRIDQYPGVRFSFSTQTSDMPRNDPTLIQRNTRSFSLGDWIGNEATAKSKFLRKGHRSVNGQSGDEIVLVWTEGDQITMEAEAEFEPVLKTLDKPIIKISLSNQTHDDNTHQPYPRSLTREEFLALWDAMVNSIRVRPGAL